MPDDDDYLDPSIHEISPDDPEVARRLLVLQRAAYRQEAELIGYDGIPPLHETLEGLRSKPIRWLGAFEDATLVGAVGYTVDSRDRCDIDRLFVDSEHARAGVGSALVKQLLRHPVVTVSTGTANEPARRLYESLGFEPAGTREIAPGVTVTELVRRAPQS